VSEQLEWVSKSGDGKVDPLDATRWELQEAIKADKELMAELDKFGNAVKAAPPFGSDVKQAIERRIPGGIWLTDPQDYLTAMRGNYQVRAVFHHPRDPESPVVYATPSTEAERRASRASAALREMVDGDDMKRVGLRR